MRSLPARQVHLDFHTSPLIPGVGSRFDKKQFQEALKEGHVNSITVFAKCHHGYCYYPTRLGKVHPTLEPGFDLTGAMIDAAHEIGVEAPVYLTVGWSALDAEEHPEWCMRDREGRMTGLNMERDAKPEDPKPETSWWNICPSGEYAENVYALIREISQRYKVLDGMFLDIVFRDDVCYCPNCLRGMKALGMDPDDRKDAEEYYRITHLTFMKKCREAMEKYHPGASIFFNNGAEIYQPEYHVAHTHLEMEDLPTTWGGYDKMPPRASFMSRYDKEYMGVTGKFHTCWGEFGGYKNPDALKYEALMMAMYGAKCRIGDQMPPDGRMDMETYRLIGHAFRALEKIEPWAFPAQSTADLGVYLSGHEAADQGLHAMLLESHIDFNVVAPGDDLSGLRAVILPDCVMLSDQEAARLRAFAAQGGAVLLTGTSAVKGGAFQLDVGAEYRGKAKWQQDFLCLGEGLKLPFGNAPFRCYQGAQEIELTDGVMIAAQIQPYFDRTYAHYCGHMNTPYQLEGETPPAAVRKGNIVYFAHPLCAMYKVDGAQIFREALMAGLRLIYTPRYTVSLMSAGRTRLTCQPEHSRFVFHASYASPVQRGRTQVLEDMPPVYQTKVAIRMDKAITRVTLVPEGEALPFEQKEGVLTFTIPCICCYQAVEICYA